MRSGSPISPKLGLGSSRLVAGSRQATTTPARRFVRKRHSAYSPGLPCLTDSMPSSCRNIASASATELQYRSLPRRGENIRHAGEDVRARNRLMGAGDQLSPQRVALLAAQGFAEVEVLRKVQVGLISTGTELCDPGEPLERGQIYNSNRIMIRAMLSAFPWAESSTMGSFPTVEMHWPWRSEWRHRVAMSWLRQAEFLQAKRTMLCAALWRSWRRAGRPQGRYASRKASQDWYDRTDALRRTAWQSQRGARDIPPDRIACDPDDRRACARWRPDWSAAVSGFAYEKRLGRTEFVPVRKAGRDESGRPILEMLGRGSSASLMSMALADGVAMLPPDVNAIERGQLVKFESFGYR